MAHHAVIEGVVVVFHRVQPAGQHEVAVVQVFVYGVACETGVVILVRHALHWKVLSVLEVHVAHGAYLVYVVLIQKDILVGLLVRLEP